MKYRLLLSVLGLALLLAGCETVQTTGGGAVGVDRQQRMMVSSAQINAAADQSYAQTMQEARGKGLLNRDGNQVNRVRAVASRLIPATASFRNDAPGWRWEVNVISSQEINAWCMPGGKIAVYTGLMENLRLTDEELAAVMGHEIAHALREHGREKASQQMAQNAVIGVGAAVLGVGQGGAELANMAAQVTYGLPNSREFEREADRIGVELAARAGYDPRAAITLWQKMAQAGGSRGGPAFLSTHPTAADRIQDLQKYAAQVMPIYQSTQRR
ncbi:MAG: M48 family metallopeptidase [Burkholderiales bacterium]